MRFALFSRVPDDPPHLKVQHEGATLKVALKRRPTATRITLRVSNASGEAVLTIPDRTPVDTAQRFADSHGGWIATRLAKLPARVRFEAGAVVPLRGVPHRIVHWSSIRGITQATKGSDGAPILAVAGDPQHVARRVQDFLEAEAKRDLSESVKRHTGTLGIPAKRITVRDTKSRWGSCSSTGALNFSWRLILAPPFVLDYLAAHEVAHLSEMNHSARFWKLTRKLCPRTEEAERWLKNHGTALHRFGSSGPVADAS
ncbi:M48 family metallopeptidase [Microvirga antarctica]|uniref:M48 family metallopeptidase n=1 Tax=Microvirga antarctica TaxID=2819233 RepID=UPI001B30C27F|nr:SprT family zinc-dependent metalloprotease [Microvirga antarctica]